MKKILAGIMALCICGGALLPVMPTASMTQANIITASAAPPPSKPGTYNELSYDEYKDHIVITNCEGTAESVVIPSEIAGLPVTGIADAAFAYCKSLVSITIPKSVTSIGNNAFYETPWLEAKIAENPIFIVNNILIDGTACTDENVVIPDGVVTINHRAFVQNENIKSVTIPETVKEIGLNAFLGCKTLEEINIPEGVEKVDASAFTGTNISSLHFPSTVTEIVNLSFEGCKSLTEVTVDEKNEAYSSVDNVIFRTKDKALLRYLPNKTDTEYNVPEGIEFIAPSAFSGCDNLGSIVIPEGVESIGMCAFSSCDNLKSISFPSTVTGIGINAFDYCYSLAEITVDEKNKYYSAKDNVLFDLGSKTLVCYPASKTDTEYIVPGNIEMIEDNAFRNNKYLKKVTISEGVKTIGYGAFYGCEALEKAVIPESVELIESVAFTDCKNLKSVKILNPDCCFGDRSSEMYTVFSNGYGTNYDWVYNGILYGYEGSTTEKYAKKHNCTFKSLTDIDEDSSAAVEYKAYSDHAEVIDCSSDASGKIVIEDTYEGLPVTVIGKRAFMNCTDITSVTLPDTITEIKEGAFMCCNSLESINIPDGVTVLEQGAFGTCSSLKNIVLPEGIKTIDRLCFAGCEELTEVYIPKTVENLGGGVFGSCEKVKITIDEENKYYCCEDNIIFSKNKDRIVSFNYNFEGNYVIPDTVETIGEVAFTGCEKLTGVTIPEGVTEIEEFAFAWTGIKSVVIPKSVALVDDDAFYCCGSLESITFKSNKTEIFDSRTTICSGTDDVFSGTIYGYPASTAQKYARDYGCKFNYIDDEKDEGDILYGDANCDGKVTIADATAILQHLGNEDKYGLSEQGKKNADVDGKNGVTGNDAITIQMVDAKMLTVEELPLK